MERDYCGKNANCSVITGSSHEFLFGNILKVKFKVLSTKCLKFRKTMTNNDWQITSFTCARHEFILGNVQFVFKEQTFLYAIRSF